MKFYVVYWYHLGLSNKEQDRCRNWIQMRQVTTVYCIPCVSYQSDKQPVLSVFVA